MSTGSSVAPGRGRTRTTAPGEDETADGRPGRSRSVVSRKRSVRRWSPRRGLGVSHCRCTCSSWWRPRPIACAMSPSSIRSPVVATVPVPLPAKLPLRCSANARPAGRRASWPVGAAAPQPHCLRRRLRRCGRGARLLVGHRRRRSGESRGSALPSHRDPEIVMARPQPPGRHATGSCLPPAATAPCTEHVSPVDP